MLEVTVTSPRTPSTASLQKFPLSGLEIFLLQFPTPVLWQHCPEPGLAASPASCAMERGISGESFRRSKGWVWGPLGSHLGVASLPLSQPVFPGVGRGGAERRQTQKLSGMAAPGDI